ncbi:hypothetical protein I3J09_28165 (plasmid) [Streptomyces clavuligerus]|nr:hypothetical protein D1794_29590 [Streptomyces clavuligerus]AXU17563.1 hypothetical protein D1794_33580 [Streptomyces clavuligerus]EDY48691.1 conserved hypothetical protein [Streptomyces clavuligerus]MBY6301011.1 hypothetical protein [Streptomyces clavuligerus]QPJ97075.1 hypothetical protein GE265_28100 [Streptomyces clavuligerus]
MGQSVDEAGTWTTVIGGELVQIPATTEGIRATLSPKRAAEFDLVVARTHAAKLPQVLADWALPAEALAEEDEVIAPLKAGDHSGSIPQDDFDNDGGGER